MRISDWSSDVCSSDLEGQEVLQLRPVEPGGNEAAGDAGDQALQQNAAGARIEIGIGRTGRDDKAGEDRKSVVEGKSVSVRVDLGGRRIIKKQINSIVVYRQYSIPKLGQRNNRI